MIRVIRQTEAAECGLACLAMIAASHGAKIDLNFMRAQFGTSIKGVTLRDLMRIADELGFASRALRLDLEALPKLKLPAILHWNLNHFVVLTKMRNGKATILDPNVGERTLSYRTISNHFTGIALEFTPTADFDFPDVYNKPHLRDLWSRITGWKRAAAHLIILSVLLQFAVLAFPLFLQMAMDEAIMRFDTNFLLVLAFGFGALYVIHAVGEALRSWVILTLGQSLSFQMVGNLFHHLVRLPTEFFEKRHLGDILSRVGSTQPIQKALTQSAVSALIDGVMLTATAIFIFVYAWQLALLVVFSVALYLAISLLAFPFLRTRQEEELAAQASEQSHLMETVRAVTTIKLFSREGEREAIWRNKFTEYINAGIHRGRVEILLDLCKNFIFGTQTVLVVFLGARMIIAGDGLSIGMLFAFMSYRQQFADRAAALVQRGLEFRMLGLHLERLSDIIQAKHEEGIACGAATRDLQGAIKLDDVSFRYAPNMPFIFEGLSLSVRPNEFIAITGPSGGGKTTLLKVILGLLPPTAGEVLVDDMPLTRFGLRSWRRQTGVVSQDDQLLAGTIADNIAFFDPELDMEKIRACARAACIYDDIMTMPMNFLSLVGDMGTALSGGQRQRILIARALYQEPRILFLDEGTANLDPASERAIADLIVSMNVTRVIVAHRPELISRADRVVKLKNGVLTEIGKDISPQLSGLIGASRRGS